MRRNSKQNLYKCMYTELLMFQKLEQSSSQRYKVDLFCYAFGEQGWKIAQLVQNFSFERLEFSQNSGDQLYGDMKVFNTFERHNLKWL